MADLQETGLEFLAAGFEGFQQALEQGSESVGGFEGAADSAAGGIFQRAGGRLC